ncbi:MAG: DUF1269 domain-containing protein [Cellulomonas sp.]|uniref:DUF1269 domain-containing protein n=1 Tax=Cellulomonas sp. TaxID=40001 RepID=UPI0019ECAACD|nr:DUF1269 domain-containing protein [Cellulomonas sp.]MBF0688518.1 DUF1269 domain-containing protein [Cellulomonas sp.]
MTTFTAWRFDDVDGAERALTVMQGADDEGLVRVVDRAVVSWPQGAARPTVRHAHDDELRAGGWGALWGLLLGALFFVPLLGAAAGAAAGAIARAVEAVGISKDQMATLREQVTPGTSALFVVTEDADLDRLAERFHGLHSTLVSTNLTDAERQVLYETFG